MTGVQTVRIHYKYNRYQTVWIHYKCGWCPDSEDTLYMWLETRHCEYIINMIGVRLHYKYDWYPDSEDTL